MARLVQMLRLLVGASDAAVLFRFGNRPDRCQCDRRGALDSNPQRSGAVSARIGVIQYGTGIFGSACVGYFADGTALPMALTIAGFAAGSLLFSLAQRANVEPQALPSPANHASRNSTQTRKRAEVDSREG